MKNTDEVYTYWKKPWAPRMIRVAILLQILGIVLRIMEYRDISQLHMREKIFSPSQWESYASSQQFGCAINGLMILVLLSSLMIGRMAQSKKDSERLMGRYLSILALLWGGVALVIPVFSQSEMLMMWALLLASVVGGAVISIWNSKKT